MLTTHAQENFSGVRVVRAYRQEAAETARFAELNDTYVERNIALGAAVGAMNPMFGSLAGLSVAIVLGLGGALVVRGAITVGAFVAFGFYLTKSTWPMIALWLGTHQSLPARRRIDGARCSMCSTPNRRQSRQSRHPDLPPAQGGRSITFRDVGFHFSFAGGR